MARGPDGRSRGHRPEELGSRHSAVIRPGVFGMSRDRNASSVGRAGGSALRLRRGVSIPGRPQGHRKGPLGRIAVVYVEWSGADEQTVVVTWTVVDGAEAARSFADTLGRKPFRQAGMPSISGVIGSGMKLFADLEDEPARRVIDTSSNGPNNVPLPNNF